jgi:hypothetical protein
VHAHWRQAAEAVNGAQARLRSAFAAHRQQPQDPALQRAWQVAARELRATWQQAWPPQFSEALERLREGRGDAASVEPLLVFLEARPRFFRSGYVREQVLRLLSRADWSVAQAQRLRAVVLEAVEHPGVRAFRPLCAIARRVETPALKAQLQALHAAGDPAARRRAGWVLEALAGAMTEP